MFELDYDKLARSLVREFLNQAHGGPDEQRESYEQIRAERDEYARRLEIARHKLGDLLGGGLDETPAPTEAARPARGHGRRT